MAEAVISVILDELAEIVREQIERRVRLVMNVEHEIGDLKRNLEAIRDGIADAERKQLSNDGVKRWLDELKDVSYDVDSVLDEWITALFKSRSQTEDTSARTSDPTITTKKVWFSLLFSCFRHGSGTHNVIFRLDIAEKIRDLNAKIDGITRRKNAFNFVTRTEDSQDDRDWRSTTSELGGLVYGQDRDKENLIGKLREESEAIKFIPVVGMAGIGKTTLAKNVYNDEGVKAHFRRNRVWVCVSEPFKLVQIAKEIIEQLTGSRPTSDALEPLMKKFRNSIKDKRFLLVLDDVWTSNYQQWEPLAQALSSGAAGSRVVVTMRKEEVAKMIGDTHMIRMAKLSEEDCWLILSEIAFFKRTVADRDPDLEEIGRKIARKCDGLPLAAKTLGGLLRLRTSKEEWHHVWQSDLWELEGVNENLFRPLLLSYYDLPAVEKRCLLYCAIFPKDHKIERDDLIQQWVAQGYFYSSRHEESAGQTCFNSLAMRSLFQDFEYDGISKRIKSCKMHDIVHDFVQSLTLNEYGIIAVTDTRKSLQFKGRHLNLMVQSEDPYLITVPCAEKLYTLVVSSPATFSFPSGLSPFKCLRLLSLTLEYGFKLPDGLGDLIHLRHLCLSAVARQIILPARIGDLFNLQTLRLGSSTTLPPEMGKLTNLRHLYSPHENFNFPWPKEIGNLKGLQTMEVIRCGDENEVFQIRDLGNLNNLRSIHIEGFGRDEREVEGARQAQLSNKKELLNLELNFWSQTNDRYAEVHMNVLEALQPHHQKLRRLRINNYRGRSISPIWITWLNNLEQLELTRCNNCESLPPLGKLSSLESLTISMLKSLKSLGPEFLGIESGTCDNNVPTTSFPKLNELKLELINALCQWNGVSGWSKNGCVAIMPRIENLFISNCSSLESLPDFLETTPLKKMVIESCPGLEKSCENETGKDWPKIRHVPPTFI